MASAVGDVTKQKSMLNEPIRFTVGEDGAPASADVWDADEKLRRVVRIEVPEVSIDGASTVIVTLMQPFEYEGPVELTTSQYRRPDRRRPSVRHCPDHETVEVRRLRITIPDAAILMKIETPDGALLPYAGAFELDASREAIVARARQALWRDGHPVFCDCPVEENET